MSTFYEILEDSSLRRTTKCTFHSERLAIRSFPELSALKATSDGFERLMREEFDIPVLVNAGVDIGIEVPSANTTLRDVADIIGHKYPIKVIEVATQSETPWSVGAFAEYLEQRTSDHKILNMISLEFSKTPLAARVVAPTAVRRQDWINVLWPLERRARGDYPQVQKYCLCGMAGSYTDFHIDFGGTSVWYHVIRGHKRFYLIEPTLSNLRQYARWSASPDQETVFLGDADWVDQCWTVDLTPGQTLLIPSGWIHAVYTPEDSLVFGGNFLHSQSVLKQLQSDVIETQTRVAQQYRFPHFRQINWYALKTLLPYVLCRLCESGCVLPALTKVAADPNSDEYEPGQQSLADVLVSRRVIVQAPFLVRACELWLGSGLVDSGISLTDVASSSGNNNGGGDELASAISLLFEWRSALAAHAKLLDCARNKDGISISTGTDAFSLVEHVERVLSLPNADCDWLNDKTLGAACAPRQWLGSSVGDGTASTFSLGTISGIIEQKAPANDEPTSSSSLVLRLPRPPRKIQPRVIPKVGSALEHAAVTDVPVDLQRKKNGSIKLSLEMNEVTANTSELAVDRHTHVATTSSSSTDKTHEFEDASGDLLADKRYHTRGRRISITYLREATDTELGSGAIANSLTGCESIKASLPRLCRQADVNDKNDDGIYGGDSDDEDVDPDDMDIDIIHEQEDNDDILKHGIRKKKKPRLAGIDGIAVKHSRLSSAAFTSHNQSETARVTKIDASLQCGGSQEGIRKKKAVSVSTRQNLLRIIGRR